MYMARWTDFAPTFYKGGHHSQLPDGTKLDLVELASTVQKDGIHMYMMFS